jgi:hypothetical protein
MSCHFKIRSMTTDRWNMLLVNEQRRTFSCIGYTIACTVAGPHDLRFLPMLIYERMCTQESPHTEAEVCYLGQNCDHKSRAHH